LAQVRSQGTLGERPPRSFRLTAELENHEGNAEGALVTVGRETGGYALVVQDARPTFHYNWLGRERYAITSTEPLPNGPCTIRFDFAYDGGGAGKGGTGTLSVNGSKVAEGRVDKTVPVVFSTDDTFDVGADWGHAGLADLPTAVRVHRHPGPGHDRSHVTRTTQRKPRWHVDVSSGCAMRAAGR
jgi:hypothetical protein